MNLNESITIAEYEEYLQELQKLVDDGTGTAFYSGHPDGFRMETDSVSTFITMCENIKSVNLTEDAYNRKAS